MEFLVGVSDTTDNPNIFLVNLLLNIMNLYSTNIEIVPLKRVIKASVTLAPWKEKFIFPLSISDAFVKNIYIWIFSASYKIITSSSKNNIENMPKN